MLSSCVQVPVACAAPSLCVGVIFLSSDATCVCCDDCVSALCSCSGDSGVRAEIRAELQRAALHGAASQGRNCVCVRLCVCVRFCVCV